MKYLILLALFALVSFNEAGIPGGINDAPKESVTKYLEHIEKSYNSQTSHPSYGQVLKVISAKSQVVAGIRYIINYQLAETECKREEVTKGLKSSKDCKPTKVVHDCIADVVERAWENSIDVVEMKCNDVLTQYYKRSN